MLKTSDLPNIKTPSLLCILPIVLLLNSCNNSSTPTDAFGKPIKVKEAQSISPTVSPSEPTVNEQIGEGLREGLKAAEKTGKPAVPAAKVAKEIILNPNPYIGNNRLDNPDALDRFQKSAGDVINGGLNGIINGNQKTEPASSQKPIIPYKTVRSKNKPTTPPPAGSEWVRVLTDGGQETEQWENRELPQE